MKSGQVIPYTAICNYLGEIILIHADIVLIDNAITDINRRLNNLLAEFLHRDSVILSIILKKKSITFNLK